MKKTEIKKTFFEKGAKAFQKITGYGHRCYCCPICKKIFPFQALESGVLTLEHVPPEKLGGKPIALTCMQCNATAGYSIDAAIVNRDKLNKSVEALVRKKGNYEGKYSLKMGGETINVNLEVHDGNVTIKPPKEINNPVKLSFLKDYIMRLHKEGRCDGEEFRLSPQITYHHSLSKIGDLKTAFLVCFSFFGYSYILNDRLTKVREQIIEYNDTLLEWYWILSDEKVKDEYAIFLLNKPISVIAVKIGKITILLPWFNGHEDIYGFFANNYANGNSIPFSGNRLPWPETLEMRLDFSNAQNNQLNMDG